MTSNRSFFNLQRELLRRNIILPVLSGIGFFCCLPLLMLMMLQNQISHMPDFNRATDAVPQELLKIVDIILSNQHDGVKLGMVIMATLSAVVLFRYLHSKKQTDFFHSLPISRGNLFVQLYVTGFMSVNLPIVLSLLP